LRDVRDAILKFVRKVRFTILEIKDAAFEAHIRALISAKLQAPLSLGDAARDTWAFISDRRYDFARIQRGAVVLSNWLVDIPASRKALANFTDSMFNDIGSKMLLVQAVPRRMQVGDRKKSPRRIMKPTAYLDDPEQMHIDAEYFPCQV
jgi:hypothetical protein